MYLKNIPLFSLFILLFLASLTTSASEIKTHNSPTLPAVSCDTFWVKQDSDTLRVIAKVLRESKKNFRVSICSDGDLKFIDKKKVVRINQVPYTYSPLSHELLIKAQNNTLKVMVILENGNRYLGEIISLDREKLVLETQEEGTLELNAGGIRRIDEISDAQYSSGVWITSHGTNTRYFFGTNGYSLEKNTGYYQNTWVLFNQFSYGLTDNLSVGGGLVPLFLFGGAPTPIWGTLKYSLPLSSDNFHFAGGMLFGTVPGEVSEGFGLFFGQATFGSEVSNINFGMGYGFGGGTFAENPAFSISILQKMGRKAAFVSENYLINTDGDYVGLLSAGVRFYLRSVSIDGALIIPASGDTDFFALPWLGLTIPFGE